MAAKSSSRLTRADVFRVSILTTEPSVFAKGVCCDGCCNISPLRAKTSKNRGGKSHLAPSQLATNPAGTTHQCSVSITGREAKRSRRSTEVSIGLPKADGIARYTPAERGMHFVRQNDLMWQLSIHLGRWERAALSSIGRPLRLYRRATVSGSRLLSWLQRFLTTLLPLPRESPRDESWRVTCRRHCCSKKTNERSRAASRRNRRGTP